MDFVSWDDFPFPTEWKVIIHSMVPVTTNQIIIIFPLLLVLYPINHYFHITMFQSPPRLNLHFSWLNHHFLMVFPWFWCSSHHQPGSYVEMGICHGIHQGTGREATSKHTTFRTTLAAPPWQNATDVFTDINGLFMINMASQWLIISSWSWKTYWWFIVISGYIMIMMIMMINGI